MVEAPPWTAIRRASNPRFEPPSSPDLSLDIPPNTPTAAERSSVAAAAAGDSSATFAAVAAVASWYLSNVGVLLLNKYLLTSYGFRFPIFLTLLHMLASAALSSLSGRFLRRLIPHQRLLSRRQLLKIASLAAIFSLSVVLGNASLRFLPVSFNQAIGATTPFFTAAFAFLLTCRSEPPAVYLSLVPVVSGVLVATRSEPLFHPIGFLLCVGSTAARALKSVVQGILLTSDSEKLHSMNLLLYMAPMAALVLLPISLCVEGNVAAKTLEISRSDPFILVLLLGNAVVAYLVNLTNFLVTKHTSALTLQVLGNAKAAVAATVSVLIFRNPVTAMGMMGFGITIFGVVLYSEAKKRAKAVAAAAAAALR